MHVTTIASLEAPFSAPEFETQKEQDLDTGLLSILGLLRQLAGDSSEREFNRSERGDTHSLLINRNNQSAPAPALEGALTAPPSIGVRMRIPSNRKCQDPSCEKTDVGGGRCTGHGGGKRCAEPECDSGARKGGKCISHGGGARCAEPECDKGAADASSAKCITHGGGKRCDETDCDRPRRKGSKCGVHAGINVKPLCVEQNCRHKAISDDGKCKEHGGRRRCNADGCPNVALSAKRGTCARHEPPKICDDETGCDKVATARGKCDAHGGGRIRKLCAEPECRTRVVSGTKCAQHGGGGGCRAEGCTNLDAGGGKCVSHGGGRRCQTPGCPRGAVGGVHCVTHGGGKRCVAPNCQRIGRNGSLCLQHGGGKPCGAKGCGKWDAGNGFCRTHGGGRRCVVPGCDTSAKLRGLCQKHGGGSMCQIDRCERGAKVRNLCSEHGGSKQCSVPGCEKLDRGRGFCQKHGELVGVGPPRCAAPFCDKKAVSRTKELCAEHGGGRRCVASGCQKIARTQMATCLLHAEGAAARV